MIRLLQRLAARVMKRPANFVIGEHGQPYLVRWWVIPRNRFFNVYVHQFYRSDDDRALHDHPWWNVSLVLVGEYIEHRILAGGIHTMTRRKAASFVARMPRTAHRIELLPDSTCTTLFITGPRVRDWGFHCLRGWVPWQRFTKAGDAGAIGAGCDALNEEPKA